MKRLPTLFLSLTSLLLLIVVPAAATEPSTSAADATALEQIFHHYEQVRLTLADDRTEQVSTHAAEMHQVLEGISDDFSAARVGVETDQVDDAKALMPELLAAAAELEASTDLDSARDAFYELSKPMVRLRKTASGDLPVVAYCPMAKRSWLQPEGELGNPYYGQSMLTCGSVVDP